MSLQVTPNLTVGEPYKHETTTVCRHCSASLGSGEVHVHASDGYLYVAQRREESGAS